MALFHVRCGCEEERGVKWSGKVWRGVERWGEVWKVVETLWRIVISHDMRRRKIVRIVVKGRGCFCFRVCLAVMAGPHLAALGLQATTVEGHGLNPDLLQLTVERKITASLLTLGLVAEMGSLVFVTI